MKFLVLNVAKAIICFTLLVSIVAPSYAKKSNSIINLSSQYHAMIKQCANQMPLHISHGIISTESNYNPFAIGINHKGKSVGIKQPTNYQEAVITAKKLIQNGQNIDMGLAQINSSNLKWLGLNVEQVFDVCTNLKAMQYVFLTCYKSARNSNYSREQKALSCYNTGSHEKGFFNGYVNKVTRNINNYLAVSNVIPVKPLISDNQPPVFFTNTSSTLKTDINQNVIAEKEMIFESKNKDDLSLSKSNENIFVDIFSTTRNDVFN